MAEHNPRRCFLCGEQIQDPLNEKWYASAILDDERFGIVSESNTIIVGLGSKMIRKIAERIASDHNKLLRGGEE